MKCTFLIFSLALIFHVYHASHECLTDEDYEFVRKEYGNCSNIECLEGPLISIHSCKSVYGECYEGAISMTPGNKSKPFPECCDRYVCASPPVANRKRGP